MNPPSIFNGKITLQNRASGVHRTFCIHTQKTDAKFAPGKRIISLLVGPDNMASYKRFGFVDENGIHVWSRLCGRRVWSDWQHYAHMLWEAVTDPTADHSSWARDYKVMTEKKCIRCNRTLTTPESITNGIGPVCAGRD